ncbi:MAG: endo-1,4-beta-xylanase [Bacteroidales bacterium]|nr:endo-1,4-beta-xylanase [Bacteroidales bacterium]
MNRNNILRRSVYVLTIFITGTLFCSSCSKPEVTIKDTFKDYFLIGGALNAEQILGIDSLAQTVLIKHFNSVTAENAMKWERIHPEPDQYNFELADSLVALGVRNGMFVIGHTLVWHHQTPNWVFEDSLGNPVTRDVLLQRMKDHIFTVVGRYKGRINGWDLVNEALTEDGQLRNSKWYEIIGEDYIQKAFEFAHEADPEAELYYNDYNIENPGKREGALKLLKSLQESGAKIDGVGIQAHWHLDFPELSDIDTSASQFGALGLKVMYTELDVNVLPRPENLTGAEISQNFELNQQMNPFPETLPDSMQEKLSEHYATLFKIFLKHSDYVSRVTLWGIQDGQSWLNNWPVQGRTNYPLLFDRNYQPKPAYYAIIKTAEK